MAGFWELFFPELFFIPLVRCVPLPESYTMKILLACFMLFADFSYSINSGDKVIKYCESCAYHGTSFKVRSDKKSGKYVQTTIAPCELYKGIIPDSCASSVYSLFLKGRVGGAKNPDNLVLGMRYAYMLRELHEAVGQFIS
jgi:hypothetical protein